MSSPLGNTWPLRHFDVTTLFWDVALLPSGSDLWFHRQVCFPSCYHGISLSWNGRLCSQQVVFPSTRQCETVVTNSAVCDSEIILLEWLLSTSGIFLPPCWVFWLQPIWNTDDFSGKSRGMSGHDAIHSDLSIELEAKLGPRVIVFPGSNV